MDAPKPTGLTIHGPRATRNMSFDCTVDPNKNVRTRSYGGASFDSGHWNFGEGNHKYWLWSVGTKVWIIDISQYWNSESLKTTWPYNSGHKAVLSPPNSLRNMAI